MSAPAVPRSSAARTGVWVGLGAIAMSFAAYTSALLVRQADASGWQHLGLPAVLYLNTAVLLASSLTLELGQRSRVARRSWLLVTLLLGLVFLLGQVVAWRELVARGVYLASNPASAFFYILTGLHGLHLAGGLIALGLLVRRPEKLGGSAWSGARVYWHGMGALWLYLLLLMMVRL